MGSATSIVTTNLMDTVGVFFPEAHLDAAAMADLAEAGYIVIGFDNVMPLFCVWHESAALGCPSPVRRGGVPGEHTPEAGRNPPGY